MATSEALWPKFSFQHPPSHLDTLLRGGFSVVKNSPDLPMGGRPFSLLPRYSYVPSVTRKNSTRGVPAFFLRFFDLREQIRLRVSLGLQFKVFSTAFFELCSVCVTGGTSIIGESFPSHSRHPPSLSDHFSLRDPSSSLFTLEVELVVKSQLVVFVEFFFHPSVLWHFSVLVGACVESEGLSVFFSPPWPLCR